MQVTKHDQQEIIERLYSRRLLKKEINKELVTNCQKYIDRGVKRLSRWLVKDYYPSKNERLSQLKDLCVEELVISVYSVIAMLTMPTQFTAVSASLASKLGLSTKREGIHTMAEILAVLCETDAFDITDVFNTKGDKDLFIINRLPLSKSLLIWIERASFLPPMVRPPKLVVNNSCSGYLNHNESVILQNKNHHLNPISLDCINTQNQIPLRLDLELLKSLDEVPNKPLLDKDSKSQWDAHRKQSIDMYMLMKDEDLYFSHRYDKRGRMYTQGYHINPQGTAYKKASLSFSIPEPVSKEVALEFSGYEWVLIDIASNYGLDKETFEDRLMWSVNHIDELESLAEVMEWKQKPLYVKGVLALRAIQRGEATGHMVGLDAASSGLQIMSVITGCISGCKATGLIDRTKRPNAYQDCVELMQELVPEIEDQAYDDVKQAVMTTLYGSKREPIKLFGEDTIELETFYDALDTLAPGAVALLDILLNSWQPHALKHSWVLPDNHHVEVKVEEAFKVRIEVDELKHRFTYIYYENSGTKSGLSNAANVIHSIDAYILRCLIRECNYDLQAFSDLHNLILEVQLLRSMGTQVKAGKATVEHQRYIDTGIADATIIGKLNSENIHYLSSKHLADLQEMICNSLQHKPFEIIAVHDDFKCRPDYVDYMRMHYRKILGRLARGKILDDILSSIEGKPVVISKLHRSLDKKIENSRYGIC